MLLIFLLTFASVFFYQTNGQEQEQNSKHSNLLTVEWADDECEAGWYLGYKGCKVEKVWHIRPQWRINKNEIASFPLTNIYQCIDKCLENAECVRVSFNLNTCFIGREDYSIDRLAEHWTSAELVCCKLIHPRRIYTNQFITIDLPIVYNPITDCEVGSIKNCSRHQRAWFLKENTRFVSKSYQVLHYERKMTCLNRCLSNTDCANAEVTSDNQCSLNYKDGDKIRENRFDSYFLQCCNVMKKSLWENRGRNLPILYNPQLMCISHKPFVVGQKECKIKIWHAFDGGLMTNPYYENKNVEESKFNLCLNYCVRDNECGAVSIGPSICSFFYNGNNRTIMKYGVNMFTTYQLNCCNMK